MDSTVLGVTKSQTQLNDFHFTSWGNIAGPLGEPQRQWFAVHFKDPENSQKCLWPLGGVSVGGSEHSSLPQQQLCLACEVPSVLSDSVQPHEL